MSKLTTVGMSYVIIWPDKINMDSDFSFIARWLWTKTP